MSNRHRSIAALWLGLALSAAVGGGQPPLSQALFTDVAPVGVNTFTSGVWGVYYLHNNPTPPVADTSSQATLPLDRNAPTASRLFNYDRNRDSDPGLLIREDRYQVWATSPVAADLQVAGDVTLTFWSAMDDFVSGMRGVVTLYLLDVDGSSYTFIASATKNESNWQAGSSSWVEKRLTISGVDHTLPAGHSLGLVVYVEASSADDMWFAYDTTAYPSRLELP